MTLSHQIAFGGNPQVFNDPLVRFFEKPKYVRLTERQAWEENKKGTQLFFGDGPDNRFFVDGPGELIGIEYCGSIPFRAKVTNCETEWFCNCWKRE